MIEDPKTKPDKHGITTEAKQELVKLAKKIEDGEVDNPIITDDIARELIKLAQQVEAGTISNVDLAMRLARIFKRLSRGQIKSLKRKKKEPKTILEVISDQILKTFAKQNINRKQDKNLTKPGTLVNNMINDLDNTITALLSASRLDSDINDIRLIEDVMAVNQKLATLVNRTGVSLRNLPGMSARMMSAMAATASVGGSKGLGTLSTLKAEVAAESWNEANRIDYEGVAGRVEPDSTKMLAMQEKFMMKATGITSRPQDLPMTDEVKAFKEKKGQEWEQSASLSKK